MPEEVAAPAHEAGGQAYRVRRSGLDAVEFLLAAGPSEPLRPLGAVASGGESARIMLALKAAPALAWREREEQELEGGSGSEAGAGRVEASGSGQIMVLDELDSGVGGRLGQPVARLLRRMSAAGNAGAASQILCVSHLPQVRLPWPQLSCPAAGEAVPAHGEVLISAILWTSLSPVWCTWTGGGTCGAPHRGAQVGGRRRAGADQVCVAGCGVGARGGGGRHAGPGRWRSPADAAGRPCLLTVEADGLPALLCQWLSLQTLYVLQSRCTLSCSSGLCPSSAKRHYHRCLHANVVLVLAHGRRVRLAKCLRCNLNLA